MGSKFRFIEFNIGLLLISSSSVLGRYITASSTLATFARCAIATLCLFALSKLIKRSLNFNWKEHGIVMLGTSSLMAIHWTAYFYALDYSNVAIAIMTLYTFPAMTAIIEPLWFRRRIPLKNVFLAVIALIAVGIIAPPGAVSNEIRLAVALGLFSALCYSIRNVWILSISQNYTGSTIMTYQLGFMSLFIAPFLFFVPINYSEIEWSALIILGVFTTAIGHTLFMRGLTYYEATTASILACTIPVYAIWLGYFFMGENPSLRTYIGGAMVIGVVLFKALEKKI